MRSVKHAEMNDATVPLRVGDDECSSDPWCGDHIVYNSSKPPWFVRSFIVVLPFLMSMFTLWLPRLLLYKTKKSILRTVKRWATRPLLLLTVACAIIRIWLEFDLIPRYQIFEEPLSIVTTLKASLISTLLTMLILQCWPNGNSWYSNVQLPNKVVHHSCRIDLA